MNEKFQKIISNTAYQKALALFVLFLIVYFPVFPRLIHAWEIKPQSSHGYFIIPICLWLLWRRKEALSSLAPQATSIGTLFLAVGMFLCVTGNVLVADTVINLSMMFSLAGIIISCLGFVFFRTVLFPFVFLVFMFPVPDAVYLSITSPMKLFVSDIATFVIRMMGISVFQDGNILQMVNFKMEVVEACSGLRSLVTYVMLGVLMSDFMECQLWKKIILISCALPIAILINVIRITGTGILANTFGEQMAQGFFHEFSGVITFIIGLVIFIFILKLLTHDSNVRTDKVT
ncbi:exosortase/archaeosortase family protein [Thermodesulfobacteriota bacterium]